MSKKTLILTLLLVLVQWKGFLLAQTMMQYTSGKYMYSLQIPEEWKRLDEVKNSQIALVLASEDGASVNVAFYNMKELNRDKFIVQYEKSMRKQLPAMVMQEKGMLKSRDDEAMYLVYTFEKDGVVMKEKACFYVRANEIAVLTANYKDESFHHLIPVFDKIFKSFTFSTDQEEVEKTD